ncbi:hypothetical protein [Sphingomonas mali]|uniref:hypothetical protein n=1 Tax=Sphingomonas mali TaxID=40682 RepID=UPI00082C99B6|nr:hypothetical protein [Sphingomonas mali]
MSDISIRLDGLLLGLVIVAGGGIFIVAALLSTLRALLKKPADKRSWTITSHSLWLVLAHAVALVLLAAYTDSQVSAPTGPDWIDWLAVPWLCFILAGLVLLLRRLRRDNRPDAT